MGQIWDNQGIKKNDNTKNSMSLQRYEKLLFIEDYQLINVEEITELESYDSATINAVVYSGTDHCFN